MTDVRSNKGFHSVSEHDHPFIFVDGCMQAWPDAEYALAHRYGVTAYAVTAWEPHLDVAGALEGLMYWHLVVRNYPDLIIARKADDIYRAKQEGKAAFILASQCGDFVGRRLHRIDAFYQLGLRILILAYSATNDLCDGCLDRTAGGLTRYGEMVVDECDRVGMVLDLSHIGKRSTLEIIDRSVNPTVFTHSGTASVVENPRNIDDEQIKACADRGGVIGLASWGPVCLKDGATDWPTLDDFIDQVDHVVQLTGSSKHVGIGTDMSLGTYPDHEYDPWGHPRYLSAGERYDQVITADVRSPMRALKDFNDYSQVANVIARLKDRGYSEQDVANILGENFMRVFKAVWK